jgi:DNA-binding Lrp family transcriptional regulator
MTVAPPIFRKHRLMKPLDAIDRRLVALLQDNARTSTVALAKAVGLSRSTVQERLQRLETAGVIAQYTVRLRQGRDPLQAWLLLRFADGFSCDDVMPLLESLPAVQLCHSVAGDTDLMVLVHADTPTALADLRERIAAFKGVDDVTTVPVLRVMLDRR